MSFQIIIKTQDNKELVLEFLDNPFTIEFISHLKKIKDLFVCNFWKRRIPERRGAFLSTEHKQHLEQQLINDINALNDMGLNFPISIEEIRLDTSSNTQNLLNRLHRHYTTSNRSVSQVENVTTWLDNSIYTFRLDPEKTSKFSQHVHNINTTVHEAEQYLVMNARQLNFTPSYEHTFLFDSAQPKDPNNNPQEIYFQKIKSEHFQYFTDQLEYDVWLPLQIQGKNYWTAYFDNDDPTHWDVSTNIVYSGSFTVSDRSAARDPALLDYLRSYGIVPGPLHCGMPLGKIISGKEILTDLTDGSTVHILP
jgi:hypothetical protein